jgi:hypothetical protein
MDAMMERMGAIIVGAMITVIMGCAGSPSAEGKAAPATDPVPGILNRGLVQLDININGLNKRIAELEKLPDTADPILQELRALDLSGWQLHRQQWTLQRDHLKFARDQVQRAHDNPTERPQLLQQWTVHEQQYERALDDLRQQRFALEQKRFQVEAQLVERSFR